MADTKRLSLMFQILSSHRVKHQDLFKNCFWWRKIGRGIKFLGGLLIMVMVKEWETSIKVDSSVAAVTSRGIKEDGR